MELIDEFIERYTKEFDFYNQAAWMAQRKLDTNLQAAGVRSIVTARAKAVARCEDKCRQRNAKRDGGYSSIGEIYDDMVDLAGVRVALYFPAELDQVEGMIKRLFDVSITKKFPDPDKAHDDRRFSGYWATHYRVQLKEDDLTGSEKRYAAARIEIQVASVLMHAWSEVEHDLVYKPLSGQLSGDELSILDQLNGLVLAGEIALERLQKAGEARVSSSGKKIESHYDLAVHLLSSAQQIFGKPISEAGLGRVDLLFALISEIGVDTPGKLQPYIDDLHDNLELRPLSEQIIDSLLREDSQRYQIYENIRGRRPWSAERAAEHDDVYRSVGMFIARWVELEKLFRDIVGPRNSGQRLPLLTSKELRRFELLGNDSIRDFEHLRRIRNELVHGVKFSTGDDLDDATRLLESILDELDRNSGPDPA